MDQEEEAVYEDHENPAGLVEDSSSPVNRTAAFDVNTESTLKMERPNTVNTLSNADANSNFKIYSDNLSGFEKKLNYRAKKLLKQQEEAFNKDTGNFNGRHSQ